MLDIVRVVCGAYEENAYIIDNRIVIDPGDDFEAIFDVIKNPAAILLTHGHFDHMLTAEKLQDMSNCPVFVSANDAYMLNDISASAYNAAISRLDMPTHIEYTVLDGSFENFSVLPLPGHTKGSVGFYDIENKVLFSGDTLFCNGFGRTDLVGGSAADMRASLRKLFTLPDDTFVYPGHAGFTTIGEEKARYGL